MSHKKYFPTISVKKQHKSYEGTAGIKLKSILKGDLLLFNLSSEYSNIEYLNQINPHVQHRSRMAFLHAVSAWPAHISLELHLTTIPDLRYRNESCHLISIFILVNGNTIEQVKEDIASHYLSLMPLLSAHMPEVEFLPIFDEMELRNRRTPFEPIHAMTIQRRTQSISLSAPFERVSISGFGNNGLKQQIQSCTIDHVFPWIPSYDDWSRLLRTFIGQINPFQMIIRIKPTDETQQTVLRLTKIIEMSEEFLSSGSGAGIALERQTGLIRDVSIEHLTRLFEPCFNLGVFLLGPCPIDSSLCNVAGRAITLRHQAGLKEDVFMGGFTYTAANPKDVLNSDYFSDIAPFTLPEAACAFRLPSPPFDDQPGLPVKRYRTSFAILPDSTTLEKDSIELFVNDHQGFVQPIQINADDRMRHVFVLGQTGTGKSTLMENMIVQDIYAGQGVGVIDPHGDMVDSILDKIPQERIKDVILFDLLERERPMGFNLLQWKTIEERDLIIDELYLTLDRVYDFMRTGGPIFESHFRGILKLLMGDKPRKNFVPTILEFSLCYLNADFRNWLRKSIHDQTTLDFIQEMEDAGGDAQLRNVVPYITSKINRYINDNGLQRIIGQERTCFDFDDVMNNGKIFLLKLGKGRFGATVSALIANQMVSRFKHAAMKRGDMPQDKRRDFYLYVDEAHNMPMENFMELLAEARKYRMGLVLGTQYTAQLKGNYPGSNDLMAAIFGNIGTILTFRLGREDAELIDPLLSPYFSAKDISGLPNFHGYARLQLNNEATPPFSFRTLKNETSIFEGRASEIINFSRKKYGIHYKLVDDLIIQRRKCWKDA